MSPAPPAVGIHDHDSYKTGLRKTDPSKRLLAIDEVLAPIPLSQIPGMEDRHKGVIFTLGGNDKYGTCGPTGLDNNKRSTSKVATGTQLSATDAQIFGLYKTQNPNFRPNPQNPVEDNGVEMGSMLDAALAGNLPGFEGLVAFGRAKTTDDAMIERLVAIFGNVLFAVDLETAQQMQTDATPPVWDYKKSGQWGGHAIASGKYTAEVLPSGVTVLRARVISWNEEIDTTDPFREHQLEELWVPIWQWHLDHPAFLVGVDQGLLAEQFHELTGKTLPLPPSPGPSGPGPSGPAPGPSGPVPGPSGPAPGPTGTPPTQADREYWEAIKPWTEKRHYGPNRKAAEDAVEWARIKGL